MEKKDREVWLEDHTIFDPSYFRFINIRTF